MQDNGWGIADPAALAAGVDAEIAARRLACDDLVRKGRMNRAEANHVLALLAEIRTDLDVAFGPPPWLLHAPGFDWRRKVRWIRTEMEGLEASAPELVAKGRLRQAEVNRSLATLRGLLHLYWTGGFGWQPPEGEDPVAATRALLAEIQAERDPPPALL